VAPDLTASQAATILAQYGLSCTDLGLDSSTQDSTAEDGTLDLACLGSGSYLPTRDTTSLASEAPPRILAWTDPSLSPFAPAKGALLSRELKTTLRADGSVHRYDAAGNRIRGTHLATGTGSEYAWDARDWLATITLRATAEGPATEF